MKKYHHPPTIISVCSLSICSVTCRHTPQRASPHATLQSPQEAEVSGSPGLPPAPTTPVTCGKPEQEHEVHKHEATQVSEDHLQERVGLSDPPPGQEGPRQARALCQPGGLPWAHVKSEGRQLGVVWWFSAQESWGTYFWWEREPGRWGWGSSFKGSPSPGSRPDCLIVGEFSGKVGLKAGPSQTMQRGGMEFVGLGPTPPGGSQALRRSPGALAPTFSIMTA